MRISQSRSALLPNKIARVTQTWVRAEKSYRVSLATNASAGKVARFRNTSDRISNGIASNRESAIELVRQLNLLPVFNRRTSVSIIERLILYYYLFINFFFTSSLRTRVAALFI